MKKKGLTLNLLRTSCCILLIGACTPSPQKNPDKRGDNAIPLNNSETTTEHYDPSKYVDYYNSNKVDFSGSLFKQMKMNQEIPSVVTGKLLIHINGSESEFQISPKDWIAKLETDYDEEEVYDVNKTSYECYNRELKLELGLYNIASSLKVELNGREYELSTIDGASDVVIRGLDIRFEQTKDGKEIMTATIKEDIGLWDSNTKSTLILLKGSQWSVTTPLPKQ